MYKCIMSIYILYTQYISYTRNSSYFASLIMFMNVLYLDNNFRTQFLSFYYFYCYSCCLLVFLLLLLVLLFCWCFYFSYYYYYYIFIKFFLILCDYVRYYFVQILDSPIIFVHDVYHFMLFLISTTLVLCVFFIALS